MIFPSCNYGQFGAFTVQRRGDDWTSAHSEDFVLSACFHLGTSSGEALIGAVGVQTGPHVGKKRLGLIYRSPHVLFLYGDYTQLLDCNRRCVFSMGLCADFKGPGLSEMEVTGKNVFWRYGDVDEETGFSSLSFWARFGSMRGTVIKGMRNCCTCSPNSSTTLTSGALPLAFTMTAIPV